MFTLYDSFYKFIIWYFLGEAFYFSVVHRFCIQPGFKRLARKLMGKDAYLPAFYVIADVLSVILTSVLFQVLSFTYFVEFRANDFMFLIICAGLKFITYIMYSMSKGGNLRKVVIRRYGRKRK